MVVNDWLKTRETMAHARNAFLFANQFALFSLLRTFIPDPSCSFLRQRVCYPYLNFT